MKSYPNLNFLPRRNIFEISYIFICLFIVSSKLIYPQWIELNSNSNATLNSVTIIDSDRMCVVGSGGTVLTTLDGGITWNSTTIGITNEFSFVTNVLGTYWAVGYGGIIIKSTNNGLSWQIVTSGTTADLTCIKFVNVNTGYITGRYGSILKSTDGGSTWIRKNSGTEHSLRGIDFVDSNNGFAVGGELSSPISVILKTVDGGETWENSSLSYGKPLLAVDFYNLNIGFAIGINGFVLKTSNGGISWQQQYTNTFQWLYSLKVIEEKIAFIVGGNIDSGIFLSSYSGGEVWKKKEDLSSEWLLSIDFFSNNIGLIVGSNGKIFKTTNAGNIWAPQNSGTTVQLNGVTMTPEGIGLSCGGLGTILFSSDMGQSWLNRESNISQDLNGISLVDTIAWIVGANGTILKSSGNFQSWEIIPSGITDDLLDVEFKNLEYGITVGRNGKILKSTNGGLSWTLKNSGTLTSLRKVEIISSTDVLIIGGDFSKAYSLILKSTDSGESWNPISLSGQFDDFIITDVDFLDENVGYLVTTSGGIFKTNNGGVNWNMQNSNTDHWLYGVTFFDRDKGWSVGGNVNEGIIIGTTDGGITWHPENIQYSKWLYSVDYADSVNWIISGFDGVILKNTVGSTYIPVELISFSANIISGTVELLWETITEKNNLGFWIDRLIEGQWTNLSFVPGYGTTTEKHSYLYQDCPKNFKSGEKLVYRLRQVNYDGTIETLDLAEVTPVIENFTLNQNYPNPFNPETIISFTIPLNTNVKLSVFNAIGEQVETLINSYFLAGSYELKFNATHLPSGIYFYNLLTGEYNSVKKMILLK